MFRVLHIIGSMNIGGAETFLMKVYRGINRDLCTFDFIISDNSEGYYESEIRELGGRIHRGTLKSKNPIKSFLTIRRVVKLNEYKTIFRATEHSLAFLDLLAAMLGGAEVRVIRSTNTKAGNSVMSRTTHLICRPLLNKIATIK